MRLYHLPNSSSQRVLWALEEAGAQYELTIMGDRASRLADPEYMTRHPMGRVPVLELDGEPVFESAALILHVADSHPEAGLIPPVGTRERALVYQWFIFAITELQARVAQLRLFGESGAEGVETALASLRQALGVVDDALEGKEYLVGGHFSVADLLVSANLASVRRFGHAELSPRLASYLDAIEARPARQRALDRNPPS